MGITAVITGGSDGIGYAIAERFLQARTNVVIVACDEDKLSRSADALKTLGGAVRTLVADLYSPDAASIIATYQHLIDTDLAVLHG